MKSVRVKSDSLKASSALLALALAGCAALGGKPAPLDTFELSAPSIDSHGHSRRQILIAQPSALKALDSQNIVIKPADRSIQYLKGAQWADRLPLIVQARLAETFQRSGSFAGVGKPGEGLAIDFQVIVEIRSFEVRVDGGDHAEVDLFVRILNDRNGEVRASKSFTASAPVSGSGNPAFVGALDAAFGDAARQIVRWADTAIRTG
ncbi:ABC transporter [Mesorhizobium loti]|nr:ABC transporter [Mesorhizobium loti]